MIDEEQVQEILRLRDGRLFHREGRELEFKEQFSLAALADYLRDFAAFANNRGGHLIFGVKDSPRELIGLSEKSLEQFDKVDPERITGFLNDCFSSEISWSQARIAIFGMQFGVFRILPATTRPVIARRDEGKDQTIKNGEIYYRYGGRTQRIQSAELEAIIRKRIEQTNQQWMDLVSKIGRAGAENAAILDTNDSSISKGAASIAVIDENLVRKLKFIRKGEFVEEKGETALQLVGDVVPVDRMEVIKREKENLVKSYPLAAREVAEAVKNRVPGATQSDVWEAIRDNSVKENTDYSVYNFRNKMQQDRYEETGEVPPVTPSIYNQKAVDFLAKSIESKDDEDAT